MQLCDIFLRLGDENFQQLIRSVSIGRLKTYQLFDRVKTRLYLTKLNSETLRKATPRLWARIGEHDEDFGAELGQVILISHLEMIRAVLDSLGIPHEEGFFAKDAEIAQYLKEGWQQETWNKFHTSYSAPALLFYINHLAWEISKAEEVFHLLLETAASTLAMNELYEAVRARDLARIQALVDADPGLAIFAAAMLEATPGDTAHLEELLAANRSLVSAVSPDGWTPLHLAAFFGAAGAARVLLNKGASPATRSTNPMENLPLHAAAAGRHAALVKLLIEHGSPVGARQHGGWTALHAAAQNGDLDMAEILVSAGADVSARADNNQCALDLALTKGHQQMVEFLEAHGASL